MAKTAVMPLIVVLAALFLAGCGPNGEKSPVALVSREERLAFPGEVAQEYYPVPLVADVYGLKCDSGAGSDQLTLRGRGHTIVLIAGEATALVDGQTFALPASVRVVEGIFQMPKSLADLIASWAAGQTPRPPEPPLSKPSLPAAPWSPAPPPDRPLAGRRVVLDAGHGGKDPGAIGPTGLREKDIALDVTQRVGRILEDRGATVYYTRTGDVFISLPERSEIANRIQPELFCSLHVDAALDRGVRGVETFVMDGWRVSDHQRARNAQEHYCLNDFLPPDQRYATVGAQFHAFCQKLTADRLKARQLASYLQQELVAATGEPDRGVKTANFSVLRDTYVPAVLVEIGFMSSSLTEARLAKSEYRQRIADHLAAGLERYLQSMRNGVVLENETQCNPLLEHLIRGANRPPLDFIP